MADTRSPSYGCGRNDDWPGPPPEPGCREISIPYSPGYCGCDDLINDSHGNLFCRIHDDW
jgi:hypothetical protein